MHKLLSLQKSADLCKNAKQLDWTITELKAKTKDQLIDLLLSTRQYLPMARLVELIYSITNIRMSQGTVANMLARVTKSVEPIYKGIQQSISEAAWIKRSIPTQKTA